MDTFQLSVYNFIKEIHFTLRLKCSQKIESGHLTQYVPNGIFEASYNVSVRGIDKSFSRINDALSYANENRDAEEIVVFIGSKKINFGCSSLPQSGIPRLSVVINRDIQFLVNITELPLTFETLVDLIFQKLEANSMAVDWKHLDLDTEADNFPTSWVFSRMERINSNLEKVGEAKVFLKSSNSIISRKPGEPMKLLPPSDMGRDIDLIPKGRVQNVPQEKVVCTQETFNQLIEGIEKLEISIGKSLKNDVFVNIPLQDEELFEFYNKIKTEGQLLELKHSYEKYQQWLTLYGSDENKVEAHLIKQNDIANDIINSSIKSDTHLPQFTPNTSLKDLLSLKVFSLDRNICFKFTNDQATALPEGLVLEISYTVDSTSNATFSIDLVHGVGSLTTKTFTRFKHELGSDFDIQNITHVQILWIDENCRIVLYNGKSNCDKEVKEDKPVKFFDFKPVQSVAQSEVTAPNDIISTDIDESFIDECDRDDYDVLSQAESESYHYR
ncbi:hypothetical protein MOSE0_F05886 [Monosporozyma servazzii]